MLEYNFMVCIQFQREPITQHFMYNKEKPHLSPKCIYDLRTVWMPVWKIIVIGGSSRHCCIGKCALNNYYVFSSFFLKLKLKLTSVHLTNHIRLLCCSCLDAGRFWVSHFQILQIHFLELGQHLVGVARVSSRDFSGEVVELGVVLLLLLGSPLGPILQILEAPVTGESVVQNLESVAGHVHLVNLKRQLTNVEEWFQTKIIQS